MRGHLTDREMMELVADALEGATLAHLRRCVACRAEYARLHATLVDLTVDARARAERSDAFFQRQRVRIGCRAGDRPPFVRRWRSVWAPALATAALVGVFLTRGGPPHPRTPGESQADQALLSAVQQAIHAEAPAALHPAALLIAEVERSVPQPNHKRAVPKGDQQ
jgi:hypothetical protein